MLSHLSYSSTFANPYCKKIWQAVSVLPGAYETGDKNKRGKLQIVISAPDTK